MSPKEVSYPKSGFGEDLRHRREVMRIIDRSGWGQHGSSFASYRLDFGPFFTDEDMQTLAKKPFPVVIDLLSSTHATSNLLSQLPQSQGQGIAVELRDRRHFLRRFRDKRANITQVEGDLTLPRAWEEISSLLDGRKADLVMERGNGALAHLPKDERLYRVFLSKIWDMLSSDGGMFIGHFPYVDFWKAAGISWEQIQDWISNLNANAIPSLMEKHGKYNYILRIAKTPQSLEKLPSFS